MQEVSPFLSIIVLLFFHEDTQRKKKRNKCQAILCKSCCLKIRSNVNGKHVMMSCGFSAFTLILSYNRTSILGEKNEARLKRLVHEDSTLFYMLGLIKFRSFLH